MSENESIIETVATGAADTIVPNRPGINIAIITAIMDMIFELINRCRELNNDDDDKVADRLVSPNRRQHRYFRIKTRRAMPRECRDQSDEVATALLLAAENQSDAKAAVAEVASADLDFYVLG